MIKMAFLFQWTLNENVYGTTIENPCPSPSNWIIILLEKVGFILSHNSGTEQALTWTNCVYVCLFFFSRWQKKYNLIFPNKDF